MKRRRRGVTLIELLIAVTLVSLLSVGILFAMRVGLLTLEKTNIRLMANRRVLGAQRILEQQASNLMVVKTLCNGPRDDAGNGTMQFFHGEPGQMRFVSRYSIQEAARGYPQVLEYLVIPGERGIGVRLVVNELPYTGPPSVDPLCVGTGTDPATGFPVGRYPPVQPSPRSFVLADKLARCEFQYQIVDPGKGTRFWARQFQGLLPPAAIRVEMTPLEPDSSRLQMATHVIPVHVFRSTRVVYKDIDEQETVYE
ncbi:MAG: prepilin-type N-terminal cleavage/methylation domain-containing protein [Acidobacteria bacterium]|nr:prepilin-type N-terminal cleavage/methylation domain-containing protein [Acidobacteriota bacterium]